MKSTRKHNKGNGDEDMQRNF